MEHSEDALLRRLRCLSRGDIEELLVAGLKVSGESLINNTNEEIILLCSKELRSAAGSSVRNAFRGEHEFPYKQILIDVADKITPGSTPLSWTGYKLNDSHTESEIEDYIATQFEVKAKKYWSSLSPEKKSEFVGGIKNAIVNKEKVKRIGRSGGTSAFVTQQIIENIVQTGIITGLAKISATGVTGVLGATIVSQLGWLIVLQTVGWMSGVKFLIFGVAGHGAMGGAISGIGSLAVGGVLSIPTLFVLADGAAYRKTVPSIILLIGKLRLQTKKPSFLERLFGVVKKFFLIAILCAVCIGILILKFGDFRGLW